MFGWKEGTDTNQINKIVAAFKKLPSKISLIKSFEWGTNNSPEGLAGGLTHCFVPDFFEYGRSGCLPRSSRPQRIWKFVKTGTGEDNRI